MRSARLSAKTISLQALLVVGLLLLLEGLARIAYTVHSGPLKQSDWFTYSAQLGWDRRPNFSGTDDCGAWRSFDRQGLLAADAARLQKLPAGGFRALFLGDSNVYGYCLDTGHTFVEVANRLVPDAASINLGVSGYTSYQGYKALLKYGDRLEPDIIFVSFNFNDRRFVLGDAQADSDAAFERLAASRLVRSLSETSYLVRLVSLVSRGLNIGGAVATGAVADVRLDKVRPRVDAGGYRENLTKMAQWARERGIPVVFILLGDNPTETYALNEGIRHLNEKNYELAIKYLGFAKNPPRVWFSALAALYLAKAYSRLGRRAEAEQALSLRNTLVSVHGGYPIVLDRDYNAIMREVAGQLGVPVVDAAAELSRTPGAYFDFCHFDAMGHEIVARLVAPIIEAAKADAAASKRNRAGLELPGDAKGAAAGMR